MKWNLEAERDIWTAICAPRHWFGADGSTPTTHPESLYWFVRKCWGVDAYFAKRPGEARWFQDRVHKPFISWLQLQLETWMDQRRHGSTDRFYIAVILPRGFGKTVITSKSAMLWMQLDDPDMSTLWMSGTHPLAKDILASVQQVISGKDRDSWFPWLYGLWKDAGRKWNDEFCHHGYRESTNLSEPSFDTTGIEVGMTGYHHDVHDVDDPILKPKLREGREAYLRSVHSTVDSCYNALKPNGLLMLTLTRYLDDDVAGRHMKREGVATWDGMPCPNMAIFEEIEMGKGAWHVYFWQTEDEATSRATLPEVYNEKKIAEHKRRDPEDFACQQQNNPGAGEHTPLLEWQLRDCFTDYTDLNFLIPAMTATVHIDCAFKRKENIGKGDYTTIVVWLHDERPNGLVYLDTDLLRGSNEWRADTFHDELIKICVTLRKRGVYIRAITDDAEIGSHGGGDVYANQIKAILAGAGFHIPYYPITRQGTRKRSRIRTAAGYWAEGFVRIFLHRPTCDCPKGVPNRVCKHWYINKPSVAMFNQMLRIDAVDHDDYADAASDVFVEKLPGKTTGLWRRPLYSMPNMPANEGAIPLGPESPYIKDDDRIFGSELARQISDTDRELATSLGPGHGPDEDWIPTREPV
jgi:hypothetical protein